MNITSRSRYGLKIMMDLALMPTNTLVKRGGISQRQGVPAKYLDQIMILLRRADLIKSVRGRDGGYSLASAPEQISVWDIFHAVEGFIYPVLCVGDDHDTCQYESMCVTRDPWQEIFSGIKKGLQAITLKSLADEYGERPGLTTIDGGTKECLHGRGFSPLEADTDLITAHAMAKTMGCHLNPQLIKKTRKAAIHDLKS